LRVEREDSYASELLHSLQHEKLSPPDHGLATQLVMGVLRWQSLLDKKIAERSSQTLSRLDPEVLTALRLAASQLRLLDRVPERAAVHESVELVKRAKKRSAVPFANAVLRKLTGAKAAPAIDESRTPAELAEFSAHPLWMVERWAHEYGFHMARQICVYDQRIPETTIRVADATLVEELKRQNVQVSPGHFLASAYRVASGDLVAA